MDEKPKRGFQYSLRVLLIAVMLLGSIATLCYRWEPWVLERVIHAGPLEIRAAAFSPDSKYIVAQNIAGTGYVFDLETGSQKGILGDNSRPPPPEIFGMIVTFCRDSRRILLMEYNGTLGLWNALTGQKQLEYKSHGSLLKLADDGQRAFTLNADNSINELSINDGLEINHWKTPVGIGWPLLLFPDNKRVVVTNTTGVVTIWDLSTNEHNINIQTEGLLGVYVSSDGNNILTVCNNGRKQVWSSTQGQLISDFRLDGRIDGDSVDFSANGNYLAATNGLPAPARIWDLEQGRMGAVLVGPTLARFAKFSLDGQRIVTGGVDESICIWVRRRPMSVYGIAVLPEFWLMALLAVALTIELRHRRKNVSQI